MGRKLAESDERGQKSKVKGLRSKVNVQFSMFNNLKYIIFFLCIILCGCKSKKPVTEDESSLCGPTFCEDSAYVFCAEQCQFGPRTMNSEAHEQCAEWIINKFKGYGCTVVTQKANLRGWDGTMLASTNIIASINPDIKERYLLCATRRTITPLLWQPMMVPAVLP